MGKVNFRNIGYGMNERDAMNNARNLAMDENGHQDGYSGDINSAVGPIKAVCKKQPKPAKTCKVEKTPSKGTKKWETVYVVSDYYGNENRPAKKTQGEAIKRAKELTLNNNRSYSVTVEKRLVGASSVIATVHPKKCEMGQWVFTGEARD